MAESPYPTSRWPDYKTMKIVLNKALHRTSHKVRRPVNADVGKCSLISGCKCEGGLRHQIDDGMMRQELNILSGTSIQLVWGQIDHTQPPPPLNAHDLRFDQQIIRIQKTRRDCECGFPTTPWRLSRTRAGSAQPQGRRWEKMTLQDATPNEAFGIQNGFGTHHLAWHWQPPHIGCRLSHTLLSSTQGP